LLIGEEAGDLCFSLCHWKISSHAPRLRTVRRSETTAVPTRASPVAEASAD